MPGNESNGQDSNLADASYGYDPCQSESGNKNLDIAYEFWFEFWPPGQKSKFSK
jgi:hypothetical protein